MTNPRYMGGKYVTLCGIVIQRANGPEQQKIKHAIILKVGVVISAQTQGYDKRVS